MNYYTIYPKLPSAAKMYLVRRLCRYLPVVAGPVVIKPESVNADWLQ